MSMDDKTGALRLIGAMKIFAGGGLVYASAKGVEWLTVHRLGWSPIPYLTYPACVAVFAAGDIADNTRRIRKMIGKDE